MTRGIGGPHATLGRTNEWLTPPEILKSLGEFDLDPCAPIIRPWEIAKHHFTIEDDGLRKDWSLYQRIWLNPPYDRREIGQWMQKLAEHGNGIALIFARTETSFFQNYVFEYASSVLFIRGRLSFYDVLGNKAGMNGGAPSALIAYGENNSQAISESGIKGAHLPVNIVPIVLVGISETWRSVITVAINRRNGEADIQAIYSMVEQIAPDKVAGNKNYREKIRQQLQYHFTNIARGVWRKNESS